MQVTEMQFSALTVVTIRDQDTRARQEMYDTRMEYGDKPTREEMMAFVPGHRIYVDLRTAEGEPASLSPTALNYARMITLFYEPVLAAIRAAGSDVDMYEQAVFSPYAGCDCPCSGGFIVPVATGSPEKDVWITISVRPSLQAADIHEKQAS